jgi:pimeloyl-ACP methyl ester carboxylesterase
MHDFAPSRFVDRRQSLVLIGSFVCAIPSLARAQAGSLAGMGVVLLHGKGGGPGGTLGGLAADIQSAGGAVAQPAMPWQGSGGKPDGYLETYDQAMGRIDRAAQQLRSRGARKIVVGGHSFGANAAIGYAARRGGSLAGVVALGPGHIPEAAGFREVAAPGVSKARQLVAAGKGDTPTTLPDVNQGATFQVNAKPAAYLSYFDPNGPAVMPRNAGRMPAIPFLWVVGTGDPMYQRGQGYAYARAPRNPKSRYLTVGAGHFDTPNAAREQVVAWLRAL